MKLPFFKTKRQDSLILEMQSDKLREEILKNFEKMLPLPHGQLSISYVFSCNNGRKGDIYAAKLGEEGDEVKYFHTKKNGYQISGITRKMELTDELIKHRVLEMAEKGIKFNCILTGWNIVFENEMHK